MSDAEDEMLVWLVQYNGITGAVLRRSGPMQKKVANRRMLKLLESPSDEFDYGTEPFIEENGQVK